MEIKRTTLENDTVWWIDGVGVCKIKDGVWLSIDFTGVKIPLKERIKVVKEFIGEYLKELGVSSEKRLECLLDEKVLKNIKKKADKKYLSSYSAIMVKIICYCSDEKLKPVYGTSNDYDSYDTNLRISVEKELDAYGRKYGRI